MGFVVKEGGKIQGYKPLPKGLVVFIIALVFGCLWYLFSTDQTRPVPAFTQGDTVVFKADQTLRGVVKDVMCRHGYRSCDYIVAFAAGEYRIKNHSMEEYELLPAN